MPDEMRVHDAFHVRDIQRARHVRGDADVDQARRPTRKVFHRASDAVCRVRVASFSRIAAPAVVVEYVALAPSLPSWWQLRPCTQQPRQAAQVQVEECISTCAAFETPAPAVCAAPASVAELRAQSQLLYNSCCEQQKRCGVTSLLRCEQQRRCGTALFNCCYGSRGVAATPFVDCCWEQQRRCDVTV